MTAFIDIDVYSYIGAIKFGATDHGVWCDLSREGNSCSLTPYFLGHHKLNCNATQPSTSTLIRIIRILLLCRPCHGCTKRGRADQCIDGCDGCRRARARCEYWPGGSGISGSLRNGHGTDTLPPASPSTSSITGLSYSIINNGDRAACRRCIEMGLMCTGDRNAPAASASATSMQAASSGSMDPGFIGHSAFPGESKFRLGSHLLLLLHLYFFIFFSAFR